MHAAAKNSNEAARKINNRDRNFILQQGLSESDALQCSTRYGALQFQPRIVGVIFLLGLLTQSSLLFFALSALLWWSALRPEQNPFEMIYNRTLAARPGAERLAPARPPRLFAQKAAGTLALLIALCLFFNRPIWAYLLEIMMFAALAALIFGGFCIGSTLYFMLRGEWDFVKRTLPWA